MSTFLYAMLAIVPIVVLFLSFYSLFRKRAQGVPMKKAMVSHIATLLGGIAVGSGAPAAIAATSEDPKSFAKSMLFVALGEAIAIYGLVIALLMLFS